MADVLGDEFYGQMLARLEERVSPRRLRHILGVADTAKSLAQTYGLDEGKARIAGLLHDWDKGLDDEAARQRVRDLGIEQQVGPWVVEHLPQVLHGPTAAVALSREHPEIPGDVVQAIYRHTTAAPDMAPLDMVVYVADAIEPGRDFEGLGDLRSAVGRVPLDGLFFEVYKFWTISLIGRDRVVHPDTMSIWNAYAASRAEAKRHKTKKAKRRER